jgi:hypothetical protein
MSKRIFKYQAQNATMAFETPSGKVLRVDMQDGKPTAWVAVDPDDTTIGQRITLAGTGETVPDGEFINTLFSYGFVFHAFVEVIR